MSITHTMGDHLQKRRRSIELKYCGKDRLSDTVIPDRPPTGLVLGCYQAVMHFDLNYD